MPRVRASEPDGSNLVTLIQVDTRAEAEVIISMLRAYGIFAQAGLYDGHLPYTPILIARSDLEAAQALLAESPSEG